MPSDEEVVTRELHRAYLETEGYPFEADLAITQVLARRLRERKWYTESSKALKSIATGELSNNAKTQLKKTLRKLLSDFEAIKAEHLEEDVHFLHLKHQAAQLTAAVSTQQNQKYKHKKFKYESAK